MNGFTAWAKVMLIAATLAAGVTGCAASSPDPGTNSGAKTPASGAPPAGGGTGAQSDTMSTPH
jgi:hypothetical protein